MRTKLRTILTLGLLAMSCAAAYGATDRSEWTGTVASVAGDDLALVGVGIHFHLSGPAVESTSGRSIHGGDLTAGSTVTVSAAEREADGRLRATLVRVMSKNPFALSGFVGKIADDRRHVEVEGVSISVDDRTAFSGRNASGRSIRSAADLRTGEMVRLSLSVASDGTLHAESLADAEPQAEPGEVQELKGTVDAVTDAEWKIGGRVFTIDDSTVFVGNPGAGDFVEVRFHSDGQDNDVADRIEKEDANDDEFELRGVVEAIGDTSWTISGQVVLVNASTQITGSPAVGDAVEAEGARATDGSLTARQIHKEDGGDAANDDHGGTTGGNDDPSGDNHGGGGNDDHSGGSSGSGSGGSSAGSSGSGGPRHGHGSDDPSGDD